MARRVRRAGPAVQTALAVLLLAAAPRPGAAWSANGHRTVALIAQDRLSPQARKAVAALLGPQADLEGVAACADVIRRSADDCAGIPLAAEPRSEPWHFVDIPISDSPSSPDDYCPNGACVTAQARAEMKTLEDPGASAADKRLALIMLVHFVGDMHQPLHCAEELEAGVSDRGGNLKRVTFDGDKSGKLNLHSLWDHVIEPTDSFDPVELSRRLESDLQGKDVSSWLEGDVISRAAMESFQIAKTQIYPAYHAPGGSSIDAAYQSRMQPVAFERLEMAGVRLAALIEQALAAQPSVAAASRFSKEKQERLRKTLATQPRPW